MMDKHPCWKTTEGDIVVQGGEMSTHWDGVPVRTPEGPLKAAYTYYVLGPEGAVKHTYSHGREGSADDWVWFDRYLVVEDELIRYKCLFSEGFAEVVKHKSTETEVVLSGLEPVDPADFPPITKFIQERL